MVRIRRRVTGEVRTVKEMIDGKEVTREEVVFKTKTYIVPLRYFSARRRELLKAGYLEREISRIDNDMESGLLSLPLKALRRANLLRGRRNHVKHYIDRGYTRGEAIESAINAYTSKGNIIGRIQDYIDYYYPGY